MKEITTKQKRVAAISGIAATAGGVIGLIYAFKTKRKFWGYAGFFLLGTIVMGMGANVLSNVAIKEK